MKGHVSREMRRLNYLITEIDAVYHDISLKLGLADSAMDILYTICEYDNEGVCPLQEVCRRTGTSKQTINSAIRKLEAEGIVYLEQAGARTKNLCLTEEGKRLAERTAMKLLETEDDILASWPKEDVDKYLGLMEKFLLSIKKKAGTLSRSDFN